MSWFKRLFSKVCLTPQNEEESENKTGISHTTSDDGSRTFVHTGKVTQFTMPPGKNTMYLSFAGGGGGGSVSKLQLGIFYAGNGGGSAGSACNLPYVCKSPESIFEIYVGKGGQVYGCENSNSNGEDTWIRCESENMRFVAPGGKGATFDNPGQEVRSYIDGKSGYPGNRAMPSMSLPTGGDGAYSSFGKGGDGGKSITPDGENGTYGSGGGGATVGGNAGKGGDGLLIILF